MLLSMTGFGDARGSGPGFSAAVEVRSVNNRHLKVVVRGSDPYPLLEAEFEKVVRKSVRRGSVLVHVRIDRETKSTDLKLNANAVRTYLGQLKAACAEAGTPELLPSLAAGVLQLPGVAADPSSATAASDEEWPVVEKLLNQALAKLDAARKVEGQSMAAELRSLHAILARELVGVRECLPAVVANFRARILERVRQAVGDAGIAVEPDHLIREVALFADRSDVSEELSRFAAHLDQFADLVANGSGPDGAGRRLEFVVQEMGREANTLGSKAGDATVSRHGFEIKATLEKIRELVQNVE